jgi:threonine synthase
MMYYSTNNKEHRVDARGAIMAGLAPDGGLYMPESIPRLPESFFDELAGKSLQEIGFVIANMFLGHEVPSKNLYEIVTGALNFETPLVPISNIQFPISCLELFHGPTLAFKDVGARFMARLMGYFVQGSDEELTILVATSGDTGSAVASGFYNVPGIKVVILYPSGKISRLQEQQMTALGGNVTALEVDGVFDDCQRLVKQAFVDPELISRLRLSSANSINIARLIPQMFYYFWAIAHHSRIMSDPTLLDVVELPPSLREKWRTGRGTGRTQCTMVMSIPSGNFGNLTAGLMAKRMGLPISYFIAATNENDVVPEYLQTALFRPRASVATISNAMDVGNPSNFVRMLELYPTAEAMQEDIIGIKVNEAQTRETIKMVYREHGYTLDPHGAVAYAALSRHCEEPRACRGATKQSMHGIFFETAHPAKFKEVVEREIGQQVQIPERLASCLSKQKKSTKLPADFQALKEFLLS